MSLSDRSLRRLAWIVVALDALAVVASLVLVWASRDVPQTSGWNGNGEFLSNLLIEIALAPFVIVGMLIASRRPQNPIGWLLLAIGGAWGVSSLLSGYGQYAYTVT